MNIEDAEIEPVCAIARQNFPIRLPMVNYHLQLFGESQSQSQKSELLNLAEMSAFQFSSFVY